MAKIKNTGGQPRGFMLEDGSQVVVHPGQEAEFNMTEADFNHLKKTLDGMEDNQKPFELSGSHGGVEAKKKEKKEGEDDAHTPAQSTEPPAPAPGTTPPTQTVPMTDRERKEREQKSAGKVESGRAEEERTQHRGR